MRKKISQILIWTGMVLILAGLVIPLFTGPLDILYKYIFSTGAGINIVGRLLVQYHGHSMRVRRLVRLETWSSLFFGVSVYFMFTDPNPRTWIVFVLAGGAILTYTSIMIPYAQRKEEQKK